jgi:IMP cyclohydrolase
MNTYLNYNIPKYKEIIQIVLMLLGYKKEDINLPRSNILDGRKCFTKASIEKML